MVCIIGFILIVLLVDIIMSYLYALTCQNQVSCIKQLDYLDVRAVKSMEKKKKKSTINDSLLSHAVGQLDLQSQ